MNKLQFLITAKTQYNIQSPFLYELYSEVIAARLSPSAMERLGIARGDRYGQILYKLRNHYHATAAVSDTLAADDVVALPDGSLAGTVRCPHKDRASEARWNALATDAEVTLSVDLYDTGIVFTSKKLSKQHWLLR